MRFLFVALFAALALAAAPVSSQSLSVGGTTTILQDRAPLAGAEEVPFALLLGLGGTSAVFVNPARAAHADAPFIYGTVRDQSVGPVSLSAVLGSGRGRWLVSASNLVRNQNTNRVEERFDTDGGSDPTTLSTRQDQEQEDVLAVTRARIAFVGRTDFGGYAVGLFGGYRAQTDAIRRSTVRSQERIIDTPDVEEVSTSESTDEFVFEREFDTFAVGAEFALAGRAWDLAASVAYQGASQSGGLTDSRDDRFFEDRTFGNGDTFVRTEERAFENSGRLSAEPAGVSYEVIGTLQTGLSRRDYLFGAVSGAIGGDEAEASVRSRSRFFQRIVQNGVPTESESGNEADGETTADLDSRTTEVTIGYVFAHERRGLAVLAGVLPSGRLTRQTQLDGRIGPVIFLEESEREELTLRLELPLHVQVPVTRSLRLFGGGAYTYSYLDTERTTRPLDPITPGDVDLPESERSEVTSTDSFSSTTRLYGGALFAHRSGLRAQAAFRGDLAQFSGWTVSLGYRF